MTVEQAIAFAAEAHEGQKDKAGKPYILHPLRVMLRMATDEERIVAVLHDVFEDTDRTWDQLTDVTAEQRRALEALTRVEGEPYEEFIERVAREPLAVRVKLADLADNTSPERMAVLAPDVAAVLGERYARAKARLAATSSGPAR